MSRKKVIVAGASGLVGHAVMREYAEAGAEVIALSRRPPFKTYGAEHVALDLQDEAACAEYLGSLSGVTHVVYAALFEKPGLMPAWVEADHIETNGRMLRNFLEPLEASCGATLEHVAILQGTKAYGVHVEPIEIPARENRAERHDIDNFYWLHERYLKEKQQGKDWHWTIYRPQIIFGLSLGSAMNLIPAIGAYGAILREQGKPLIYPGGPSNLFEAVDADLLARAIVWGGEADAARNEIFNVTNGDVFTWQYLWPRIADMLNMEAGPAEPRSLGETMPAEANVWDGIRQAQGLVAPGLVEYIGESFHYADFCMAYGAEPNTVPPALVSTIKLRQAGFTEVMDTEAMFDKWFRVFEAEKLLPTP
ncbi:MAG: nucleoside-diphosphate sugar epimerase [Salinisphaeraceae bacterium]|nr:nucleoside-diphosphate sugar epimerase [Salinisphaeraceae bacterium]